MKAARGRRAQSGPGRCSPRRLPWHLLFRWAAISPWLLLALSLPAPLASLFRRASCCLLAPRGTSCWRSALGVVVSGARADVVLLGGGAGLERRRLVLARAQEDGERLRLLAAAPDSDQGQARLPPWPCPQTRPSLTPALPRTCRQEAAVASSWLRARASVGSRQRAASPRQVSAVSPERWASRGRCKAPQQLAPNSSLAYTFPLLGPPASMPLPLSFMLAVGLTEHPAAARADFFVERAPVRRQAEDRWEHVPRENAKEASS